MLKATSIADVAQIDEKPAYRASEGAGGFSLPNKAYLFSVALATAPFSNSQLYFVSSLGHIHLGCGFALSG